MFGHLTILHFLEKMRFIFLFLILLTSCSNPPYKGRDVLGADEFVMDSYRIREGKFCVLQMQGKDYSALDPELLHEYKDVIHEGDVLQIAIFHPTRTDLVASVQLIGQTLGFRVIDGKLWGPGALDMKAGVAMALTALEMLSEADLLKREVILLLNSDEEIGSPVSRPITEKLAKECEAVFVLEPAQGLAYKTARKGTGNWRIDIRGVAAHAGVDFEKGASALRELSCVIDTVSGWTDLKRGLTVSVGVAGGGTKTNVIPADAFAEVDVRIAKIADGPRIERRFASLRAADKRCSLSVSGGINRPPMERTRGTVQLFQRAHLLAEELGFDLNEAATGGASDGNFTSALGVPTLDGMGAVGEGAHASHESILVEHLAPRTALLAGMLARST